MAVLVLLITLGIFVVVGGMLAYCVIRYRRRADDDGSEPPQVYGSNPIEFAWTIGPILIVFVLALATTRTIYEVQAVTKPPGALDVTVIGHQWWWEIRYPEFGIVTANELHVPVNDDLNTAPTFLTLESADVVHSFWVPRLAGKTDVVPNHTNHMWFDPRLEGVYLGQCAEFCGTQHARMLLRVYVQSRADFDTWVKSQQAPSVPAAPDVAAGERVFQTTACVNCHSVNGTIGTGRFGPDLTHLMSRDTIAAGAALNTEANLRAWVDDPDHFKPGVLMPAMKLPQEDLDQLVAYLATLR